MQRSRIITPNLSCTSPPIKKAPLQLERVDVLTRDPLPRPFRLDLGSLGEYPQKSQTAREHLRLYYSDFLRVPTAEKPRYMDMDEKTVDCDDLIAWIVQAEPRSRMDAYPLLIMCRDLLQRLARRELRVASRKAEELMAELEKARATIEGQKAELDELRKPRVPRYFQIDTIN